MTTVRRARFTAIASSVVGRGVGSIPHRVSELRIMDGAMAGLLSFPNPVNEKAARTVAAGVLALSIVTLATGAYWLTAVMAYGFVARVLAGPTLSPLGQVATRLVAPRLGAPKLVPGPPKRFAQAIGAVMTLSIALVALVGH